MKVCGVVHEWKAQIGSGAAGPKCYQTLKNARYTELKQSPVNHVADLNESAKDTTGSHKKNDQMVHFYHPNEVKIMRVYIFSKNNQRHLCQRHKDNQIFHVLVDRGREWGSAGGLQALEERNTNKAR